VKQQPLKVTRCLSKLTGSGQTLPVFFAAPSMKTRPILTTAAATLIVLAATGVLWWINAGGKATPFPAAVPPAPVVRPGKEPARSRETIERDARRRNDMLALEIERALVSSDSMKRETAFTKLLPQLLQIEPARVTAMIARQEPGEIRDTLRTEVARLWIRRDRDAAIAWLKSLDAPERHAGAVSAVDALAAGAPGQAIEVAGQFDIGRDDGYLEHLVQIWATADLDAAERWIDAQPAGPNTDPLRARIALVRAQKQAGGS